MDNDKTVHNPWNTKSRLQPATNSNQNEQLANSLSVNYQFQFTLALTLSGNHVILTFGG